MESCQLRILCSTNLSTLGKRLELWWWCKSCDVHDMLKLFCLLHFYYVSSFITSEDIVLKFLSKVLLSVLTYMWICYPDIEFFCKMFTQISLSPLLMMFCIIDFHPLSILNILNTCAGEIQCEQPNNSLYTFTGNLIIEKQTLPLSPNQLFLRVSFITFLLFSLFYLMLFCGKVRSMVWCKM